MKDKIQAIDKERHTIFFMRPSEEFGELTNFYAKAPIYYMGQEWPSSEHLYQSMKFRDPEIRERIRLTKTAFLAAMMGRDPANLIREDWDVIKEPAMTIVIDAKFTQHKHCADVLVSTQDFYLAELSYKDQFWGTKPDLQGYNRLGFVLMHQRDRLSILYG